MSDFEDRNSRSNTVKFAHGSIAVVVDHWTDAFNTSEVELDLDHVMGTVVTAVYDRITAFNKAIAESTGGVTKHASTRSMTVGETSVRVKVTVTLDTPTSSLAVAGYVSEILSKAEACILHVVDPSSMEEDSSSGLLEKLMSSAAAMFGGGMPPEVADLLGGAYRPTSRAGAGSFRTAADATANTGQYL